MMIIFVIEVAYPYFEMFHKLLPDFDIRIDNKSSQIVDVVGWLNNI